ncbi:MAG: hypothetical protein ACI9S8_001663, partial [Chlamydiales bacterium]
QDCKVSALANAWYGVVNGVLQTRGLGENLGV